VLVFVVLVNETVEVVHDSSISSYGTSYLPVLVQLFAPARSLHASNLSAVRYHWPLLLP
jgi:hypothetical protein